MLWAMLHPADAGALRGFLLSSLPGLDLSQLQALEHESDRWAELTSEIAAASRRWQRNGVLSAIMPMIEQQAARLLADEDRGERALTDLRHLGELLAKAEREGRHGEALWRWLADQRADVGDEPDEQRQLRVESDRQRVKLLTLHASKGLEFDCVLLPLMFAQSGRPAMLPSAPDSNAAASRIDLGSDDWAQAMQWSAEENQRERLRLLYVALTRAVYRCDVWLLDPQRAADGRRKQALDDPERSALDRLFAPLLAQPPLPAIEGLEWCIEGLSTGLSKLRAVAEVGVLRRARKPLPPLRPLRRQLSFSSLAHAGPSEPRHAQDEVQTDTTTEAAVPSTESEHPDLQTWAALRGSQFGSALHGMLENRPLGQRMADCAALIRDQLRAFGLPAALQSELWVSRIAERLDQVLNTPIHQGVCLADLRPRQQQVELDFRLSVDRLSLRRLREVCEQYGDNQLLPAHLGEQDLRGLLVGKIDLVFEHKAQLHVLDYKSNYLGTRLGDYRGAALHRAMDRSAYRFQALLYSLAVHRYLRQRVSHYRAEDHLGECIYLFMRAVGLATSQAAGDEPGIWRHRFSTQLIEAVDEVLAARDDDDNVDQLQGIEA